MNSIYLSDDWSAFVAGIRADPDDDLRRLVTADWLEDHGGHKRATYIRSVNTGGSTTAFVKSDNENIKGGNRYWDWLKSFPTGWSEIYIANGFVTGIECPWSWWRNHGDEMVNREPLTSVEFIDFPPLPFRPVAAGQTEALNAEWPAIRHWNFPQQDWLEAMIWRIENSIPLNADELYLITGIPRPATSE